MGITSVVEIQFSVIVVLLSRHITCVLITPRFLPALRLRGPRPTWLGDPMLVAIIETLTSFVSCVLITHNDPFQIFPVAACADFPCTRAAADLDS